MDKLNNPFKVMSFIIEKADYESLRQTAFDKRISVSEALRQSVKSFLNTYGKKPISEVSNQ